MVLHDNIWFADSFPVCRQDLKYCSRLPQRMVIYTLWNRRCLTISWIINFLHFLNMTVCTSCPQSSLEVQLATKTLMDVNWPHRSQYIRDLNKCTWCRPRIKSTGIGSVERAQSKYSETSHKLFNSVTRTNSHELIHNYSCALIATKQTNSPSARKRAPQCSHTYKIENTFFKYWNGKVTDQT